MATVPSYASVDELASWAASIMHARQPDFIIGDDPDRPYMRRWFVIPRNRMQNVYLHEILRDDDDRALHDHPWPSTSLIISGSYIECMPNPLGGGGIARYWRCPGDIIERTAERQVSDSLPNVGATIRCSVCGEHRAVAKP